MYLQRAILLSILVCWTTVQSHPEHSSPSTCIDRPGCTNVTLDMCENVALLRVQCPVTCRICEEGTTIYKHCIRYSTDTREGSDSSDNHQVKIKYTGIKTVYTFDLAHRKYTDQTGSVCKQIVSEHKGDELLVESVEIRQKDGADGWGVRSLEVETYPNSGQYQIYGEPTGKKMQFWVDGDANCHDRPFNKFWCCANKKWCSLTKVNIEAPHVRPNAPPPVGPIIPEKQVPEDYDYDEYGSYTSLVR